MTSEEKGGLTHHLSFRPRGRGKLCKAEIRVDGCLVLYYGGKQKLTVTKEIYWAVNYSLGSVISFS